MTDYNVLRPVSVGKPPRQLKVGEVVRGVDLEGWEVPFTPTIVGLIGQGTLLPLPAPVKGDTVDQDVPPPEPPSSDPHPVMQS